MRSFVPVDPLAPATPQWLMSPEAEDGFKLRPASEPRRTSIGSRVPEPEQPATPAWVKTPGDEELSPPVAGIAAAEKPKRIGARRGGPAPKPLNLLPSGSLGLVSDRSTPRSGRQASYRRAANAAGARLSARRKHSGFLDTDRSFNLDEIRTQRSQIQTRSPDKSRLGSFKEDAEVQLNPMCLEMYLSNEDFHKVFGMPKEDFYQLRQWQQRSLKKKHGLF